MQCPERSGLCVSQRGCEEAKADWLLMPTEYTGQE